MGIRYVGIILLLSLAMGCGKSYDITVVNSSSKTLQCNIAPGPDNADRYGFSLAPNKSEKIEYSYGLFQGGEGDYTLTAYYYVGLQMTHYYEKTENISGDYTWTIY